MDYYTKAFKNYFVFTGRASRKEYWMFVLFNALALFAILIFIALVKAATHVNLIALYFIYIIATIIPGLSLFVRRAHDADYSGWWWLMPIFNIVLLFLPGTKGDNKYGADPYASQTPAMPIAPIAQS